LDYGSVRFKAAQNISIVAKFKTDRKQQVIKEDGRVVYLQPLEAREVEQNVNHPKKLESKFREISATSQWTSI